MNFSEFIMSGRKDIIDCQSISGREMSLCMFLAFDILDNPEMISLANFLKDQARTFFLIESIAI